MPSARIATLDPEVYSRIGYDELVTYAIYSLARKKKDTSFENIVAESFGLFPKRFSLRGYPEWPDSAVVNKSWLRCRTDKKYIVGSVKDGFKLTQRGLEVAERIEGQLGTGHSTPNNSRIKAELRTRAGRLLRDLEHRPAYLRFQSDRTVDSVSRDDFADILLVLPDTPASRLKSNLEQFKDAARLYEREDVLQFLSALEERFSARLGTTTATETRSNGRPMK